jgi:hypothetical protein
MQSSTRQINCASHVHPAKFEHQRRFAAMNSRLQLVLEAPPKHTCRMWELLDGWVHCIGAGPQSGVEFFHVQVVYDLTCTMLDHTDCLKDLGVVVVINYLSSSVARNKHRQVANPFPVETHKVLAAPCSAPTQDLPTGYRPPCLIQLASLTTNSLGSEARRPSLV